MNIKKNIFHLFKGAVVSRALTAFTLLILVRFMSIESYGFFNLGIAFATIASYFTEIGLKNAFLREGTKPNANLKVLMSSYVKIRVVFLFVTMCVGFILAYVMFDKDEIRMTVSILLLTMVPGLTLRSISISYFQLMQDMNKVAYLNSNTSIISLFTILIAILYPNSLLMITLSYGTCNLLSGIIALKKLNESIILKDLKGWDYKILNGIKGFILTGLIMICLPQIPFFILEKVVSPKELGIFSAAYRIPSALYQIPGVIAGAFYPLLFQTYNEKNILKHQKTTITQYKLMGYMGLLLTATIIFLGVDWFKIIFGEKWNDASLYFKWISFIIVFQAMNIALNDSITSMDQQYKRTSGLIIALVVSVLSYYILGIKIGIVGAVISAVLVELIQWLIAANVHEYKKELFKLTFKFSLCTLFLIGFGMILDYSTFSLNSIEFLLLNIVYFFSILILLYKMVIKNNILGNI